MSNTLSEAILNLRQRAEKKFAGLEKSVEKDKSREKQSPEELQRSFHELQVHQIELEMQNEELCRAQQQMEALQIRYFDLYDLAPIGYLTLNKQGMVLECNLAAATTLGLVRMALVREPISRFIYNKDLKIHLKKCKQCYESSSPQDWEMRMLRADGNRFWAHLRATPAHNGEYWITLNDITDKKKAEEDKLLYEQQLQQNQKLESLGVLAGGIAHDFNNILTIIMCNCTLAKQQPEKMGEIFPMIEKAVDRAAELCQQMLAYAGKTQFITSKINMECLVKEMVTVLGPAINKDSVIKLECLPDIPLIMGDVARIKQIIMNLIINASEAGTEAPGEICIRLARVEIRATTPEKDHIGKDIQPGSYACLEVSDSGCGMDSETQKRIFEPFYSTKFTGRGLGLSAVLGIITAHKGALQLFSQPAKGTTFKVYLPAHIDDAQTPVRVIRAAW